MALISRKCVRSYVLPQELWNNWPSLFDDRGMVCRIDPRNAEHAAPVDFVPCAILITRGTGGVGLTSGWNADIAGVDLMIACIDTTANREVFDEIVAIVLAAGAKERSIT